MSCVQYLQDYYVLNESPEDFEELLKMMNSFTRGFQTKDDNERYYSKMWFFKSAQ